MNGIFCFGNKNQAQNNYEDFDRIFLNAVFYVCKTRKIRVGTKTAYMTVYFLSRRRCRLGAGTNFLCFTEQLSEIFTFKCLKSLTLFLIVAPNG